MKRDNSIKENKKRKQSIKDLRKVVNKKCKKSEDISKRNNETKPIPNITDIPSLKVELKDIEEILKLKEEIKERGLYEDKGKSKKNL